MRSLDVRRHPTGIRACLLAALWLLPMSVAADEIRVVFPNQPERREVLNTFYRGKVEYFSTTELAGIFAIRTYENDAVQKQVLHFRDGEVKISAFSSFIIINDQSYQIPAPSYFDGQEYYLPVRSFFQILGVSVLKGAVFDESRRAFVGPRSLMGYNIHSASVEEKRNGILIRVRTSKIFDSANIVRYITDNGWLVVEVPAGKVDTLELARSTMGGIIRNAWGRQLDHSAELRFKLNEKVPLPEIFQVKQGREMHIALRNPVRDKGNRTEEMRKLWYLDTIVLDAGHGGKDGGTVGRGKMMEKTVCLDVALRLGKLLKRRTNMKVVYTRDEDVFIPLFQRTK
ncbi:MAG: N-acetylmuramoyl-L-alanine amidase, partial [Candidatus Neomarinimicrobiota bacterium]